MRAARLAAVAAAALALTACAAPGTRAASGPPSPEPVMSPATRPAIMPDVTGEDLAAARNLLARVKLVPIVRYAPEILINAGSVMLSMPKAGASAAVGDVVVLVVAGQPDSVSDGTPGTKALRDLAAAKEEVFVGVGFENSDLRKTLVVAMAPGVDPSMWQDRVATAAGPQRYMIRQCDHTLAELRQIQTELMTDGAHDLGISPAIRPAECAVHISGAL